ncbi:MAG TPA: hypothetical protein DDY68_03575 [Porphyromonadaceae bacterium]|nr:hypothetical protein [Porphyromonadaceae bacterium]
MNINSKIDWKGGMQITPQTFIEFDKNIDTRQEVANRVTNAGVFGIVPYSEFQCDAIFVRKNIEVSRLMVMALLPSGKILHIDESVSVPISAIYGDTFYLGAKSGGNKVSFNEKTIPFTKEEILYNVLSLEQIKKEGYVPLMKFYIKEGEYVKEDEYIPPFIQLRDCARFEEYLKSFSESLKNISSHANLESGEAKRTLLCYSFRLQRYNTNNRVKDFIYLMSEITQSLEYYVVTPNVETPQPLQFPDEYDIAIWLDWFGEYLKGASAILDKVVLEDHTIDIEKMKREIEKDLYDRIYPAVYANVTEEMENELREALVQEITDNITTYVNENLKDKLYKQLFSELNLTLHKRLYDELYDTLYQIFYVPEKEIVADTFMPLI